MSTYVSLSQVLAVSEEHAIVFENFSLEETASSIDLEVQNEVNY